MLSARLHRAARGGMVARRLVPIIIIGTKESIGKCVWQTNRELDSSIRPCIQS